MFDITSYDTYSRLSPAYLMGYRKKGKTMDFIDLTEITRQEDGSVGYQSIYINIDYIHIIRMARKDEYDDIGSVLHVEDRRIGVKETPSEIFNKLEQFGIIRFS